MNSLTMMDVILMAVTVIMLISYIILLTCKIELFSTFTAKIDRNSQNNYKAIQNTRKKLI